MVGSSFLDRKCAYKRNTEARSRNHCRIRKSISTKYYVCVYSCLSYQARKSNLSSVVLFDICALSGSTILLPHYIINVTIFGKTLLNINYVFWFSLQLWSETFIILRRIQGHIIINVHQSSSAVPLLLSDCNPTSMFYTHFRKTQKCQI